jgi:Ni2+-binding GTPase involved in maturation of urease and hydrogenase
MTAPDQPSRAAIGAPVGSGKTALMEQLCKRLRRLDAIVAFLRAKGGLKGA